MEIAEPRHDRRRERRRVKGREVAVGIAGTVGLHVLLVAAIAVGTVRGGEDVRENVEEKMMEFQDVELLKLGEDKPKHQLPRRANPAPPEPKQETVAIDQEEAPEPEDDSEPPDDPERTPDPAPDERPTSEQETEDLDQQMEQALDSLHNPRRPANDEVPEGSEKGVAGGNLSDEALANLMGTYEAKLINALSQRWTVPETVSDDAIRELAGQVEVYVRLSETGNVVTYDVRARSGNEQFDRSIERLLRQFQVSGGGRELPLPDDERVRRIVLKRGLDLKSWTYTGR